LAVAQRLAEMKRLVGALVVCCLLAPGCSAEETTPLLFGGINVTKIVQKSDHRNDRCEQSLVAGLTESERRNLSANDIVLLIDKSTSMATRDCPDALSHKSVSRWEWCKSNIADLSTQITDAYGGRITAVLFADCTEAHEDLSADNVEELFESNHPHGTTQMDAGIAAAIQSHNLRSPDKPLLLAIVTDGSPTNANKVRTAVLAAARQMRDDNDLSIVFFLVGKTANAGGLLRTIHADLMAISPGRDIVRYCKFQELVQDGFATLLSSTAASRASGNLDRL
jgi:hypothetical protein